MEETKTYVTVDDLLKQAEEYYKQFIKDGKYKDILLSMSNLNCYSTNNQLLIISQVPNARCVNSMKVWNYNHRNIIKGEKAIKIIAPLKEIRKKDVLDEDGNDIEIKEIEINGFKVAHVFDISQTEGRELYEFKCDENIAVENFNVIKEALERVPRGYKISYQEMDESKDGYCDFKNQEIVIKDGMTCERTLITLIHEIGHALAETRVRNNFKGLTTKEQAKIKEVEAESIALVVSNRLGLNTVDFNMAYITTWSDGDIEKFKSNIDIVRSVSYQILSCVEPALQFSQKEKEKAEENAVESIKESQQPDTQNSTEQTTKEPKTASKAKPKSNSKSEQLEVE